MTTPEAQLFSAKLEDQAFKAAFEAADQAGRQALLDQAGLKISLQEANAVFAELSGELSDEEMSKAAGGGFGFDRGDPEDPPTP